MGALSRVFSLAKNKAAVCVALFVVVIFGAFYIVSGAPHARSGTAVASLDASGNVSKAELLADPDHDGLPNWEEALLKTDPNKSDTDGDGMNDGDEVKAGRDPLTAGVGDLQSRNENLVSSNGALTTELTKAIVDSGALASAQKGGSPDIPTSYLQNIGQIYTASQDKIVTAGFQELQYGPASDANAIKKYFNDVSSIFPRNFSSINKIDFDIFSGIVGNQDKDENLKLMDEYIAHSEKAWSEYKNLAAPLAIKDFHERGARILLQMLFELRAFRNYDNDPALALLALDHRMKTRIGFAQLYHADARTIFVAHNIVFSATDPGNKIFGW